MYIKEKCREIFCSKYGLSLRLTSLCLRQNTQKGAAGRGQAINNRELQPVLTRCRREFSSWVDVIGLSALHYGSISF